jgi:hypothetical protein
MKLESDRDRNGAWQIAADYSRVRKFQSYCSLLELKAEKVGGAPTRVVGHVGPGRIFQV